MCIFKKLKIQVLFVLDLNSTKCFFSLLFWTQLLWWSFFMTQNVNRNENWHVKKKKKCKGEKTRLVTDLFRNYILGASLSWGTILYNRFQLKGAMKQGRGMCGIFKAVNLMYLHILHAGMVHISLWYLHVPLNSS